MNKLYSILSLVNITLIMIIFNDVSAQKPHNHEGFFLRIQTGGGYAQMEESNVLGKDVTLSGFGGVFSGHAGGVISPNIIAFGIVGGAIVSDPDLDWGGETAKTTETKLSITGLGAGLSYYIMPSNIYFSASALVSFTTLEFEDMKGESEPGIGLIISIGKEWWVSPEWGLGVAIWGHYSSMDAKDTPETQPITNTAMGLVFSATYN